MCWRCVPCLRSSALSCWVRSEFEYPRTPPNLDQARRTGEGNLSGVCILLRRGSRRGNRVVVEHRGEPPFRFGHRPALALGVILDLVALDLADAEIVALGVAEIEPAHRRARPHREAFRELDPDPPLAVEQREQGGLLAVIGLRRITRRRTDAAIFFP